METIESSPTKTVTVNAAPFGPTTGTEPDEAATPDVSAAAMTRLRSPFAPDSGARPDQDGEHRAR